MTTRDIDVQALEKQVFQLHCIYESYESLAHLASIADGEYRNVGLVIAGLNHRLQSLLSALDDCVS